MTAETEAERLLPCIQLQRCGVKNGIRHNPNCPAFYRARVTQFFVDRDAEIGRLRVALKVMKDAAVYQCAAHARGGKKLLDEANSRLVDALSVARSALAGEKTDG